MVYLVNFYLRFVIKLISDLFPIPIFDRTQIIYIKKQPTTVIIKRYYRRWILKLEKLLLY